MLRSEKFSLRRLNLVALVCLGAVAGCAKAHKHSQAAETNTEDGRVFVGMSVTSADALPLVRRLWPAELSTSLRKRGFASATTTLRKIAPKILRQGNQDSQDNQDSHGNGAPPPSAARILGSRHSNFTKNFIMAWSESPSNAKTPPAHERPP